MSKVKIIDKKSQKSVLFERELLSKIRNSFIVNLIYSFQDTENLYLVMDFLKGGDLRYHICKNRNITEEQAKFFLGCLTLGLEYIHSFDLMHRDIKPENLLMDSKGYLRITDFGISSIYQKNKKNAYDTSGTPGYMAPEVITGNNHCKVVDYFAMGIIGYELMMGERPYKGRSRKEIKEQMINYQVEIKEEDIPLGWSVEAASFFNKLLIREPENRLGYNGINEIKNNEWFLDLNFKDLYKKKLKSPYKPFYEDNFDKKYCSFEEKNSLNTIERYNEIMNSNIYEKAFINYTYYPLADLNDAIKMNNTNKNISQKTDNNSEKNSPNKNTLLKADGNFKNNNFLFSNIYHIRHISNDIGINPEANIFIPLSNRKQEIRLNKISKGLINDFRLINNSSYNYFKKYLDFSKNKRKKNQLFLTNIKEKNSHTLTSNNHTINYNRTLDKEKSSNNNNIEKKLRKEKTIKPIMKKIKLQLAKNIIKKHINSNNKVIHNKVKSNINLDINKNISNMTNANQNNYFKLINTNTKNNELKSKIFRKINSPQMIKSPHPTVGMNYIFSAKKPNKKGILNHFNLSNIYNINSNSSKNKDNKTINLKNNKSNTNTTQTQNNNIHYKKIIKNKTLDKLKNQKKYGKKDIGKNNRQNTKNKMENIIQNLYTNVSMKSHLNSPKNKRVSIPFNNLSQVISPEICNKINKNNTIYKNSGQRPNKLVKNYQKSDIKAKKKMRKINLASLRNLDIGKFTKKNSRNKILQLSKFTNINNNDNLKKQKNKKIINDKNLEFRVSIQSFPKTSLYNQYLTNQTINITLSNYFNNSTINEKKNKIEVIKPFHRRYASNDFPLTNNNINFNNNINNNNCRMNDSNIINNDFNFLAKNKVNWNNS